MDRTDLIEYVRAQRDGVISTVGPDGAPQAAFRASLRDGVVVIRVALNWARYGDFRGGAHHSHDVRLA